MRLPLTPYGMPQVAAGLAASAVLSAASFLAAPGIWGVVAGSVFAVLALWVLWFFRDPERKAPADPLAVVAPADGLVVEVAEVDDDAFIEERAVKIGIFLSVFDVHVNRSPVAGRVVWLEHRPGRFLNALRKESATQNEAQHVGLVAEPGGFTVRVTQIAGAIARRIVCPLAMDEALDRGQRYGMIKFGSRTEVALPLRCVESVTVKVGDRVKGGRDTVARLKDGL